MGCGTDGGRVGGRMDEGSLFVVIAVLSLDWGLDLESLAWEVDLVDEFGLDVVDLDLEEDEGLYIKEGFCWRI